MDGWNTFKFPFGCSAYFRDEMAVSFRDRVSPDLVKQILSGNHFGPESPATTSSSISRKTSHAIFWLGKKTFCSCRGGHSDPGRKISHQKGGYRLPSLGGQRFLQSSRLRVDVGAMLLSSTGCWIGGSEVNKVNFVKHFQKETSHVFILWVFQGCSFGPKNQAAKPWWKPIFVYQAWYHL